jgi:hypothetical protein
MTYQLEANGTCEAGYSFKVADQRQGLLVDPLIAVLANMLSLIDVVRNASGDVAGEFA